MQRSSMMPHIIPGGRQRASSDGDVLEDNCETNSSSGVHEKLTEAHRNLSRSANLTTTTEDDVERNSDEPRICVDDINQNTIRTKKKHLRAKFSFRSVKKVVSRALQKDSNFGSNSSLNKEEMPTSTRLSSAGVWTPTLRRKASADKDDTQQVSRIARNGLERTGTDSASRPLIAPNPEILISKWDRIPGNVGLFNHGNTCFMNAVIQCLSHIDSFTEYFISDLYKDALKNCRNSAKKIGFKGSKGEVLEQLGIFLKSLWSDKYNKDISLDFKAVVAKYNCQYKGTSQHDSQEFLLWLLDRIHEDLIVPPIQNKKKSNSKQTKNVVSPSRSLTNEQLAEAAESSLSSTFVTELFQALHCSSLTCPHCDRHSNTFDPYLCVSLPLPQKCLRPIYVTLVILDEPSSEVTIGINMNVYDTVKELREAIAAHINTPATQIVLCQLANDGFCATFSNEQLISDIPECKGIYAIEMFPSDPESGGDVQLLTVHVEKTHHSSERFCQPEVIKVSREINMKQLQKEILRSLGDAVRQEIISQKLKTSLFQLQVVDGSTRKVYLPLDVEMPLYTQTVDRVLSMFGEEFGPQHLKLIVEWEPKIKEAIILDASEHIEEHTSVNQVKSSAQQPVTVSLDECFKLYTQEEKLAGEDAWVCPHCQKPQKGATKTLGLWSLPDILVLHLKRFKQSGLRRNKLNTLVSFPVENLDMTPYLASENSIDRILDDVTYDLIGVCNHYGNMMGGHYTAFCKNSLNGAWKDFDDRGVHDVIDQNSVVTKSAYILFYQRRSLTKLVNQNLHMGTHWIFAFTALNCQDASKVPAARQPENNILTKRENSEEQPPSMIFNRHSLSKEWNGPSSPTRRPSIRPLTPQPQRRHISAVLNAYDSSPSANKARISFRASRPSLSRHTSDVSGRAKRQLDPAIAGDGVLKQSDRQSAIFSSGQANAQIQPETLQVQLPPKASVEAANRDNLKTETPRISSEIYQPHQVQLPTDSHDEREQEVHVTPLIPLNLTDENRSTLQNIRMSTYDTHYSPGVQQLLKTNNARLLDSLYQDQQSKSRPNSQSLQSPQLDSLPLRAERSWQYESLSSKTYHDAHSTQIPQSLRNPNVSQQMHESPKSSSSNYSDSFDWSQPSADSGGLVDRQNSGSGTSPVKVVVSGISRTVTGKPPIPPKTISTRVSENTRVPEAGRPAEINNSGTAVIHRPKNYHLPMTPASLNPAPARTDVAEPPSPAPKDSNGEIHHLMSQQEALKLDSVVSGERTSLRDSPQKAFFPDVDGESRVLSGEHNVRRRKPAAASEQYKYATIARGNLDSRTEPLGPIVPPAVPRSATDYNIYNKSFVYPSPSSLVPASQRHFGHSGNLRQNDRISNPSGGFGHWRSAEDRFYGESCVESSAPLYAREPAMPTGVRESRHNIYRGPMFQASRPKNKTSDISVPHLRESSV